MSLRFISRKVYEYAAFRFGQQVGSGECYDLANFALKNANAKRAKDYGEITATADYVWGKFIDYQKAIPGDIIQFSNYKLEMNIEEEGYEPRKGKWTRAHHTAVVYKVKSNGEIIVLEQNVNGSRKVQKNSLFFGSPAPYKKGKEKITVKVSGTYKFYRAEPKN